MKRLFLVILAITLVVGLIFAGCAKEVTPTTPTTPTAPTTPTTPTTPATLTPQYGGILKIIFTRTPKTIGYPPDVKGTGSRVTVPCLETLFRLNEDGTLGPWLVESWELAPDKKSYTFHLRKGVKFHDGTDFNAEAVKWNLLETQKLNSEVETIASMDVLDEYTIQLNLTEYDNQLISQLAERCGAIASPTAIQNNGVDWAKTHPVGTGPFEFVSFQRDVSVKYKKFDNYWQEGKPYLDGIEYSFVVDPTMAAMSFEAGEAQLFGQVLPTDAFALQEKGYEVITGQGVVSFIAGDSANPDSPFADIKVREALEFAIDREAIADGLGLGYNQAINQPCPAGYFGNNPDIKGRPYDPSTAKQLLTAAGYPDGFGFEIPILAQETAGRDFLAAIQSYLKDVGIDTRIQIESVPKWNEWVYNGWKNGLIWGDWVQYLDSTSTIIKTFPAASKPGAKYVSALRPPGYEALLARAATTSNREEQVQLTKDVYRAMYDFATIDPIWRKMEIVVTQPSVVHDHNFLQWSLDRWEPENVWLSE